MLAVATISSRAGAEETFTYRVQAGDTCAGIALRVYGDEKRIDLIHDSNADLGPPPHALAPGRVLVLPKLKTPERGGPDARVSRIRNRVEVQVPEPRPAKLEDPLVRGNRVGTEVASGADVTFRDETQVRLGERTLVVILGDRRSNAAVVSSAETMLVSGELRARLGALSGRGAPTRVETKGAAVAMTNGEAKVSVDPAEATRLAVYDGRSQISAQQKTVALVPGFGSKAELGKPPTPPRPLPPAPRWVVRPPEILVTPRETANLAATVARGEGKGPEVATWHVQMASDAAFEDLLVDERAPLDAPRVEARELRPGTYFTRVSAIDADLFEGPWSEARRTTVGRFAVLGAGSRGVRVELSDGIACALDGRPWTSGTALDRDVDHLVSCAPREAPSQAVAWVLEAVAESVVDDGPVEAFDVLPTRDRGVRAPRRVRPPVAPSPPRRPRLVVGLEGGGALRDQRQEGMGSVLSGGLSLPVGQGELAATAGFVGELYPEARAAYGSLGDASATVLGARLGLSWAPYDRFVGWSPVLTLAPELLHVDVEGAGRTGQARFVGGHGGVGFAANVGPGALGFELGGRLAARLSGATSRDVVPANLGLSIGYVLPL